MVGKPRGSATALRTGTQSVPADGDDIDSANADLDRRLNCTGFRIEPKQVGAAAGHPERTRRPRHPLGHGDGNGRQAAGLVRRRIDQDEAAIPVVDHPDAVAAEDEVGRSVAHRDPLRHRAPYRIDADDLANAGRRPTRANRLRPTGCRGPTTPVWRLRRDPSAPRVDPGDRPAAVKRPHGTERRQDGGRAGLTSGIERLCPDLQRNAENSLLLLACNPCKTAAERERLRRPVRPGTGARTECLRPRQRGNGCRNDKREDAQERVVIKHGYTAVSALCQIREGAF